MNCGTLTDLYTFFVEDTASKHLHLMSKALKDFVGRRSSAIKARNDLKCAKLADDNSKVSKFGLDDSYKYISNISGSEGFEASVGTSRIRIVAGVQEYVHFSRAF